MTGRCFYPLSFLALIALLPHAAPGEALPKTPPYGRDAVLASADRVTATSYPNADDAWVMEYIRTDYEADGTSVTFDDEYIKILTEKGKRNHQVKTFHYTLPYSTVAVHRVEIIKPDRTSIEIDVARQSRSMVDPSQMSMNIYNPNSRLLRVTVPGLEIGDLLHVVSDRYTVKARVPDTWSDYMVLEYTSPLLRIIHEVTGPVDLPLCNMLLRDEIPGTVTATTETVGNRNRYRWEVIDVPRMYEEPRMPALHTVVQRLLVSTIPDWETISRWYWNLSQPHLEAVTPAMRETVSTLTAGTENRRATIEALFRFVSQEVRYMGITPEKEAPGYEPHDVSITFANRYGVCRDKAALLVAMLRLAGLPAYPVLVHVGPKKDEAVPQPFFNHAIVAVAEADGSYLLMDPTDENTVELMPSYLCNRSYLVAHPEGERLRVSPVYPASRNLLTIDSTGQLDHDGILHMESVIGFAGVNDNAYRGYFARIKPVERQRFFEGLLKRPLPGARLLDLRLLPDDMQDTTRPLSAALKYEVPDVAIRGDSKTMLPLPWLGTRLGYVNFVLGETGLATRKYPLQTDVACGVRETFSLAVDDAIGTPGTLPHYDPILTTNVTYHQTLSATGNVLQGEAAFEINTVEFTPAEYLDLKQHLKDIEYNRRKEPIFTGGSSSGHDVAILEDHTDIALTNIANWTVTRRVTKEILTYAGKKANAELKFTYNPVRQAVSLRSATVTGADGTVHRLSPEEVNVMDAAWVASAPRYPPERTMVISLPGVEIGSRIEYDVQLTMSDYPFFSAIQTFGGFEPTRAASLRVSTPRALDLCILDTSGRPLARATEQTSNTTIYAWTVTNLPATKKEDLLPPSWERLPAVFLSAGDFKVYARETGLALLAAAQQQPVARETALRETRDAADERARVQAIRDYVARSIRHAGPPLDRLPLSAITPADLTLQEGYGNSADQAVLLYAMLDAAGLKPEFVLAASNLPYPRELYRPFLDCPQYTAFDAVLVRVRLDDDMVYLNDTDQYAQLGTTLNDERLGLTLDGTPFVIEAPPAMKDRREILYRITISPDGNARIDSDTRYFGSAFASFHQLYAELPPEERRRHYRELLATLAQSAEAVSPLTTDYAVYPGRRTFSATIERFAVRTGQHVYFSLPPSLPDILPLKSDKRDKAAFLQDVHRFKAVYEVLLPDAIASVELAPPDLAWQGPSNMGTIEFKTDPLEPSESGKRLRITQRVNVRQALVPAIQYPALLEAKRRMAHPATQTVLVRLKDPDTPPQAAQP
jgi:transglutaminase-like putative cysteine protease